LFEFIKTILQEISPVIIKMLQKNHSVQRYFQISNY
jgi:hypothetical protein